MKQSTVVVSLTSSRFIGGPERQMLALAGTLPASLQSVFVSFPEKGLCRDFLDRARRDGFKGIALKYDTPRLFTALRELVRLLRSFKADILCCHGYKANVLGLLAARWLGIPVVSVSRGWTGETLRVRLYETLDRFALRWMDKVVCVSEGQAKKVRRVGVPNHKITVIRNAVRPERFAEPQAEYRKHLQSFFPKDRKWIVGAAGRLSPEKGFGVLVDAAAEVVKTDSSIGFVLFGDGALRDLLARRIKARRLEGVFVLTGFRRDLDEFLPHLDLTVLPSFTEGLPNIVLEALAAGVPVVATAVGGTPEVVEDGVTGYLVPPGDAAALGACIVELLSDAPLRRQMRLQAREKVQSEFSFEAQAEEYLQLFGRLIFSATSIRATESTRRDVSSIGTQSYSSVKVHCDLP